MITGIVMASGFSKRMKKNKLFLKVDGETLIERVIKAVKESKVDEVIVIYRDAEIQLIGERYKIKTIYNENARKGQSSTIKLGINASQPNTDGYMFFVADQPFLSIAFINNIIDIFSYDSSKIIVPVYNGNRGNPVIFPSVFRSQLLKLEGDIGGRIIIADNPKKVNYIKNENIYAGYDIDTLEEYNEILNTKGI